MRIGEEEKKGEKRAHVRAGKIQSLVVRVYAYDLVRFGSVGYLYPRCLLGTPTPLPLAHMPVV